MMKVWSIFLCLWPTLVAASDKSTAFTIKSVSCSTNAAAITSASCGMDGADACEMGGQLSLTGTYTVTTTVPEEVEVCTKVKVWGVQVYSVGCENVNICEYIDCENSGTEDYLDSNGSPYSYSADIKIPGDSRWLGSGYGFAFYFTAYGYNGNQLEKCKVTVGTETISSSAAVVVAASLCAAAALFYRKKRRKGVIDLDKEENLVQGDFVEMAKSGVSV